MMPATVTERPDSQLSAPAIPPRREIPRPVPPSTGGNGLFLLALLLSALAMCGSLGLVIRSRGAILARDIGSLPWLPSKEALFGVRVDALSCLMLLAVTICGFLIILYSGAFMSRGNREHPSDKGQGRYYFFMVLFVAAMIGLVCSPNLFQLFIFWELTTLCSWGLISFYGDHTALVSGYKA
ncbi:MAG: hypothetical protein ABR988_13050, partial [Terriglobales bacterium]